MAYLVTAKDPTEIKTVGTISNPRQYIGVSALSGGTLTVTIPGVTRILWAEVHAQSANAAYIASSAANAFTITGTSSDGVMWMAFAE